MTRLTADPLGLSRHLDRMARGLSRWHGPGRELLMNEAQAGATRFHVDGYGMPDGSTALRLTGNGSGMTADELDHYLTTMFISGDNRPDNHGMGARAATLPFNYAGVVWATRRDGVGALLQIERDRRGAYETRDWDTDEGLATLVEPESTYPGILDVLDGWGERHGTAVLLLGSGGDTWTQAAYRELANYVAGRWWELPGQLSEVTAGRGGALRTFNYHDRIPGLHTNVVKVLEREAEALSGPPVSVGDGVTIEWIVLPVAADRREAEGTAVNARRGTSSAPWSMVRSGRVTEVGGELFDWRSRGTGGVEALARCGVYRHDVASRLLLIVHVPPTMVIHNEERSRVTLPGGGNLPWAQWERRFIEQMPPAIQALLETNADDSTSLTIAMLRELDPEWRRWIENVEVLTRRASGTVRGREDGQGPGHGNGHRGPRPPRPSPAPQPRRAVIPGDGDVTAEARPMLDVPQYRWLDDGPDAEAIDGIIRPGEACFAWVVGSQLFVRRSHPAVVQAKARFRDAAPRAVHAEVDRVVEECYGIELVSKVVHLRILARSGRVPGWTLDTVSELVGADNLALSLAVLGLQSVDRQVRAQLGRLASRGTRVA